jgi:putative tricarboxylic transport membrane protein
MSIGEGSAMVFLQRPMSLTLLIIVVVVLLGPRVVKQLSRREITDIS